jgi:MoaA/NifB/PqqE/SkfB family radical SAM enzyme
LIAAIGRFFDLALQFARLPFARHNYLIYFVTARCNARCPFCFYWKEVAGAPDRRELDLGEIERIARTAGPILYLSIGGGEPFLRDDLAEIVALFYRHCGTRILNVTTNGTLPERVVEQVRRILELCPHASLKISVSVEAWGEEHDRIRRFPGNFKTIEKTIAALDRLRMTARPFGLNVATTLSAGNRESIFELIDRVENEWPVNDHTVTLVRGNPMDPGALKVDSAVYEKVVERLERRARHLPFLFRLLRAVTRAMFRLNIDTIRTGRMQAPCLAGGRMLTLSDDGVVKPCEILAPREKSNDFDS